MPKTTPVAQLPPEVAKRLAESLNRISPELFRALDDVREFGGNFLLVQMEHPDSAEKMQLFLAPEGFRMELPGVQWAAQTEG